MSKLTREEFRDLRTRAEHDLAQSREVPSILICAGTGCIAGGAMKIYDNFKSECEARGLKVYVGLKHDTDEEKSLHVKMSGCHGFCEMGPLVHIEPMGVMYIHVKPEDCHEILEKTVLGGEVIDRLVYHLDGTAYPKQEDIPFYKKQHRVVLENCGTSDAEDIEEYIAKGGYSAFEKALFEMTDEQICRNILDSGLRGRGGGGFPAGRKWDGARKQKSAKKYIVCNGDEGDPGAFMDRSVMEGNPHSVLEGMMIAGLAVGSDEGYIYVRAEYPLAVNRLKTAIARAEEMGLLGTNILGSDFNFRIHVNKGAGAFVCGEGSALTASIEGNRGMPRVKPPRTIEHGLWAEPTVLNNVETFANVPLIIKNGVECEFIAGGTYDDSKGWFVQPTIIRCKTPTYESMVKEIFGPIVSIYVYDDDKLDETLAVCDSASPYALTGAIFAQDRTAIVKMENALRNASGNFYINDKCTGAIVGQQPFGGARASGTNDKAGTSLNMIRWLSAHSVKESFCPSAAIAYPYMSEK